MLPLLPRTKIQKLLKTTTLRGFSGGWNVLDDDMNLAPSYATKAKNMYFTSDGSAHVRYGTSLFADCFTSFSTSTYIVNTEYYNGAIIVVGNNGQILAVQGDGSITRIWDTATAAALPGSPTAWGVTDFCTFAQFNGHLVVCNGSDKPLDITANFIVDYLQDAGTGTNINTPIARYCVSSQRYLCMAGDPLLPNRIHISARDAYGTYYGDPPPNDAVHIDVGSILPNSGPIRGLLSFRDKLLVLFAEGVVIGTLGVYDADGNHTPSFNDSVEQFGSITHRGAASHGDDALMLDLVGVPSLRRTVLSQALKPERVSYLIDPEITDALNGLSLVTLEDRVFSIYDYKVGQFMLFIPNSNDVSTNTETRCFVYTSRPSLKLECWSEFRDWNWTAGCRSVEGNIFFADKNCKIWLYGNRENPVYTDYVDLISPVDSVSYNPLGTKVAFSWELPWLDFRDRARTKTNKYISFDTRGNAEFDVNMYIDNYLTAPVCTMGFSGGEQGGHGAGPQPFGGGRNTSYKKLYAWTAKFEIAKLSFTGLVDGPLSFVSITLHYLIGGIQR